MLLTDKLRQLVASARRVGHAGDYITSR